VDARRGAAARLATRDISVRDGVLVSGGGSDQKVATTRGTSASSSTSHGSRVVKVYSEGPSPGWTWLAYNDQWVTPIRADYGVDFARRATSP